MEFETLQEKRQRFSLLRDTVQKYKKKYNLNDIECKTLKTRLRTHYRKNKNFDIPRIIIYTEHYREEKEKKEVEREKEKDLKDTQKKVLGMIHKLRMNGVEI